MTSRLFLIENFIPVSYLPLFGVLGPVIRVDGGVDKSLLTSWHRTDFLRYSDYYLENESIKPLFSENEEKTVVIWRVSVPSMVINELKGLATEESTQSAEALDVYVASHSWSSSSLSVKSPDSRHEIEQIRQYVHSRYRWIEMHGTEKAFNSIRLFEAHQVDTGAISDLTLPEPSEDDSKERDKILLRRMWDGDLVKAGKFLRYLGGVLPPVISSAACVAFLEEVQATLAHFQRSGALATVIVFQTENSAPAAIDLAPCLSDWFRTELVMPTVVAGHASDFDFSDANLRDSREAPRTLFFIPPVALELGDHLYTEVIRAGKKQVVEHSIYVGNGEVVVYLSDAVLKQLRTKQRKQRIKKIPLVDFVLHGQRLRRRKYGLDQEVLPSEEVVQRALEAVETQSFTARFSSRPSELFACFCKTGTKRPDSLGRLLGRGLLPSASHQSLTSLKTVSPSSGNLCVAIPSATSSLAKGPPSSDGDDQSQPEFT